MFSTCKGLSNDCKFEFSNFTERLEKKTPAYPDETIHLGGIGRGAEIVGYVWRSGFLRSSERPAFLNTALSLVERDSARDDLL